MESKLKLEHNYVNLSNECTPVEKMCGIVKRVRVANCQSSVAPLPHYPNVSAMLQITHSFVYAQSQPDNPPLALTTTRPKQ